MTVSRLAGYGSFVDCAIWWNFAISCVVNRRMRCERPRVDSTHMINNQIVGVQVLPAPYF